MSDHIPNYKPPRLQHGRTPYQKYLCRTVMHRPERSIFCGGGVDVTYNIKTPGFWSYVGMGIGQAFGSLFGGGFGGCFGSGFGGLFGGGFGGCFGGGFPMMNFWNNPSLSWNNCNPFNWFKSKNSDGKGGAGAECEDPDLKKINALDDKVYDIEHKTTRTKAEIDALKKEITEAKKASDDNHKTENDKAFDKLIRRLTALTPAAPTVEKQEEAPTKPAVQTHTIDGKDAGSVTPIRPEGKTLVDDGKGDGKPSTSQKVNKQSANNSEKIEISTERVEDAEVTENFHTGHLHTWGGIVAHYDDCIKNGYTRAQIVAKIKEINGINKNDNVIPKDLYLPEYLFGENNGKKKALTEEQIYKLDDKVETCKTVISHGTNLKAQKATNGYRGVKTWKDGNNTKTAKTTQIYSNTQDAEKAAKNLEKPNN